MSIGENVSRAASGGLTGRRERAPGRLLDSAARPPASSAFSASSVSASATGLSRRQRSMRGNRTATPLLWRLLGAMPSKPSSNTCVGVEAAHRAEGLDRGAADDRVHLADLLVGEPRIGLGERYELAVAGFLAGAPDARKCSRCRRPSGGHGRARRRSRRRRRSSGRASISTRRRCGRRPCADRSHRRPRAPSASSPSRGSARACSRFSPSSSQVSAETVGLMRIGRRSPRAFASANRRSTSASSRARRTMLRLGAQVAALALE